MLYCENCKHLCVDDACPDCGSKLLREAVAQDYCFLTEGEEGFIRMLEGSLNEQGIACILIPFGNGARSAFGLSLGKYRIYVPFGHYDRASASLRFFIDAPSEELRKDLIDHKHLWHFDPKIQKKICRKWKLKEKDDILRRVSEAVHAAPTLALGGRIYSCPQEGRYIFVKADGVKFWFNSATYEILI